MKITDLKKELENKQKKELIYIITELYKLIVKTKKYACNVDDIIFGVKNNEKEVINIEQLYEDINTFIELAYGKCYLIPNRYVQKKDRSKWRFKVKRYYKELYGNYSLLATKSVLELYNMLSYGCAYYIFSTNDPFKSCGIIQCEMLSYVFKSVLFNSESEDNINLCIDTLLDSNLNYETSYTCLINEFVLNLKTNIS
ncbi:MAG: hypothetical protein RSF67_08830, partial [Clostridia bacterium]